MQEAITVNYLYRRHTRADANIRCCYNGVEVRYRLSIVPCNNYSNNKGFIRGWGEALLSKYYNGRNNPPAAICYKYKRNELLRLLCPLRERITG